MIPENFIVEFTENIKPLIEEINPSFFEITVGMAFDYFAKRKSRYRCNRNRTGWKIRQY